MKIHAYEHYHSLISDVEKVQCMAKNDKNSSLSSMNYGAGTLLGALYALSHLNRHFHKYRNKQKQSMAEELHLF